MNGKKLISGMLFVGMLAAVPVSLALAESVKWKEVNPAIEKDYSLFNSENYDFIKFSQIGTKLDEIDKKSNRVKVEVTGTSSQGYPLYVVTIADPQADGKFGQYQALRKQIFKNPQKAIDWVTENPGFKVPIMINGSIHGTEYIGTDVIMRLIERFATQNDEETKEILENNILIFNVVQNPDGRINATRFNGEGIDLNRDLITQSQSETQQLVELLTEWNPMVLLDIHGYIRDYGPDLQGLIGPCTPPHNPNYEYDLYNKWAYAQAEAMEAEIMDAKDSFKASLYQSMKGTYIPQRDDLVGWDDYPPIFAPMYAMYHGAYGHTLEAPTNDEDGVRWMYHAVMGALKFATENKEEMMADQMEILKRGIHFNHPIHEEGHFPNAYILPVDEKDPTVTEKAVNHLMKNDVEVVRALKTFKAEGNTYDKGTYIVKMNQAKAGLANTMLWKGEDLSYDTPFMYDIAAWNLPELWGFTAIPVYEEVNVVAVKVIKVDSQGTISGKGPFFIPNSSTKAVELVNNLLESGVTIKRDTQGNFYADAPVNKISGAVKVSGLKIDSAAIPSSAEKINSMKVAILKDGGMRMEQSHSGTKLALKRLGFDVTEITPEEAATEGLTGFNVFIFSGTESLISTNLDTANEEFGFQNPQQYEMFKANIEAFLQNGGKYIAVGAGASKATKTLGLTDNDICIADSNSNGIVKVNYEGEGLTGGYSEEDLGFVYRPVWYIGLTDDEVAATIKNSPDFFIAGHWRNNSAAQGQAIIVREKSKDVTLIGLEAGFRDHTDYLFRLLSNAIFSK